MFAAAGSRKRPRGDDGESADAQDVPFDKKPRATANCKPARSLAPQFPHDSVLESPARSSQVREQPKYDSDDDQSSSIVSEPGSPQDIAMSSGDEMDDDALPQSPDDDIAVMPRRSAIQNPWGQRMRTERVPTPAVPMRPGTRPPQVRTGIKQHIRQRHPPENSSISSTEWLEVPSPVDEESVPTPPSAAEAAGSQLSMLSVSDVDMEESDLVPSISIDPVRPSHSIQLDSALNIEPAYHATDNIVVRKQRQRSGALSSGNSPVRAGLGNVMSGKRGFSVGFRADCEKCRLRVPGHMNHFIN